MKRTLVLFCMVGFLLGIGSSTQAQSSQRCFAETGYCISGAIRTYWEGNGGLPVFGYPISPVQTEVVEGWSGPVQWFERDRLEDHGAEGIMAGRLGAAVLEAQGRPWQTLPQVERAEPGCLYFPETRHSLCGEFLEYWQANGGLARFGYPISEVAEAEMIEKFEGGPGILVQFFERRRMELHGRYGHGIQPYVLLGLLGRNVYRYHGCDPASAPLEATAAAYYTNLGCPIWFRVEAEVRVRAVQTFEGGTMFWINSSFNMSPYGHIFVVYHDQTGAARSWQRFAESELPEAPQDDIAAPPGRYVPVRGFGRLWRTNQEVRDAVGWATAPEQEQDGTYQIFVHDGRMLHWQSADRVLVLYPDGRADSVTRMP